MKPSDDFWDLLGIGLAMGLPIFMLLWGLSLLK